MTKESINSVDRKQILSKNEIGNFKEVYCRLHECFGFLPCLITT